MAALRPKIRKPHQPFRFKGGQPPHTEADTDWVLIVQRVAARLGFRLQRTADLRSFPEVAAVHCTDNGDAALLTAGIAAVLIQCPGNILLTESNSGII